MSRPFIFQMQFVKTIVEGSYVEMHIYSPQTNWNKVIEWGVECLKGKKPESFHM